MAATRKTKTAKKPTSLARTSRPAKDRSKGKGEVYTCKTCGKVTKARSHLCSPSKADEVYICTYCGAMSGDPFHVCSPMLANVKYSCGNCGRVSPFRGAVCEPKEIG